MKEYKTIEQRLREVKNGRPNRLKYGVLKIVARCILGPQYGAHVTFKTDFRKANEEKEREAQEMGRRRGINDEIQRINHQTQTGI